MKNRIVLLLATVSSLLLSTLSGFGQDELQLAEKVILCTDRKLYIAGEQIGFSCTCLKLKDAAEAFSKVLFVELVSMDGQRIVSQKHPIDVKGFTEGNLVIPASVSSGMFLLKAYTKHLEAKGPNYFGYVLIRVINAQKPQLNLADKQGSAIEQSEGLNDRQLAELKINKTLFKKREQGTASFHFTGTRGSIASLSASIALSVCLDENEFQPKFIYQHGLQAYETQSKGICLTGQVLDEKTTTPMPNKRVNLSIIGSNDFIETLTDTRGRFCFELPSLYGFHDVFINVNDTTSARMLIQVDNDFAPSGTVTNPLLMNFSAEEANTVHKLVLNYLINTNLGLLPQQDTEPSIRKMQAFYGTPDQTLVLDEFIQLPTLEEYFNELPYLVKVRKDKHRKYFKLYAAQKELELYEPLVLIDFVAISKPDKVLAIAPTEVERIEFVHHLYQRGDVLYGGIVSILSKKGNFAGVDLPGNGMFINYGFYAPQNTSQPIDLANTNLPDARNTVLWEPKMNIAADGSGTLNFTTPDTPGEYTLMLKCIMQSGQVLSFKKNFLVE